MRVDVSYRQSGKTTRLLKWLRAAKKGEHRVGVFATKQEAMQHLRENPDLESWQFISAAELRAPRIFSGVLRGRGGEVVLGVDDLDRLLVFLFEGLVPLRVEYATITGELAEATSDEDRNGTRKAPRRPGESSLDAPRCVACGRTSSETMLSPMRAGDEEMVCARCAANEGNATVVSDPVPEPWCETCEGKKLLSCPSVDGLVSCPDCKGELPYAWKLTLRRDGGGDE